MTSLQFPGQYRIIHDILEAGWASKGTERFSLPLYLWEYSPQRFAGAPCRVGVSVLLHPPGPVRELS